MSAPVDVLKAMRVAEAYCYDAGASNAAKNMKAARAAVAALIAERDALRAALKEVEDCAEYWSEYFVPIGLPDRIRAALATGESA